MAMDGPTLAAEIVAAVDNLTLDQKRDPIVCWTAITNVIVAHLQNNAVITTRTTPDGPENGIE